MSLPKLLLLEHSYMYAKRGGVAACRVVCIGLYLKSVREYVFLLVLWTTHIRNTCRCDDTRDSIVQFWPPDDEHLCSKHVEA